MNGRNQWNSHTFLWSLAGLQQSTSPLQMSCLKMQKSKHSQLHLETVHLITVVFSNRFYLHLFWQAASTYLHPCKAATFTDLHKSQTLKISHKFLTCNIMWFTESNFPKKQFLRVWQLQCHVVKMMFQGSRGKKISRGEREWKKWAVRDWGRDARGKYNDKTSMRKPLWRKRNASASREIIWLSRGVRHGGHSSSLPRRNTSHHVHLRCAYNKYRYREFHMRRNTHRVCPIFPQSMPGSYVTTLQQYII